MTHIALDQGRRVRVPGAAQAALALLIGSIVGSAATLQLIDWQVASPETGGAVPLRSGAQTTAGKQYGDWYLRGTTSSNSSTTAGRQYLDWYTRGIHPSAPSTTASRQYLDWHTRSSRRR